MHYMMLPVIGWYVFVTLLVRILPLWKMYMKAIFAKEQDDKKSNIDVGQAEALKENGQCGQ